MLNTNAYVFIFQLVCVKCTPTSKLVCVCVCVCVCLLGVPRAGSQLREEEPVAVETSALASWEPHQWPVDTTVMVNI